MKPLGHIKSSLKRGIYILSATIKKIRKRTLNDLITQLRNLEKQEKNTKLKSNRWQEVINIGSKIQEVETKKTIKRITESKNRFKILSWPNQKRERNNLNGQNKKWTGKQYNRHQRNSEDFEEIHKELYFIKSEIIKEIDRLLDSSKPQSYTKKTAIL